jgi:hypothetical protein
MRALHMSRLAPLIAFLRRLAHPVSDETAGGADGARTQFAIFATVFALAVLFDRGHPADWQLLSQDTAVCLVAIWVLLRPVSVVRFVALVATQVTNAAIDSPLMSNHWTLVAISGFAILVNLVVALLRREPWLMDPGAVFRRIAPVLRVTVVILYGFAAFAKINGDFLDPALSCGVAITQDLFKGPLTFPSWLQWPAIVGTIVLEMGLAFLLAFRRTRLLAVFVGATFHAFLALAGHRAFSGFAMAFYVLFLPDDLPERLKRMRASSPRLRAFTDRVAALAARREAWALLAGAWLLIAVAASVGPDAAASLVRSATLVVFVIYVVTLGVTLVRALRGDAPPAYRPGTLRLAHPGWALGPLLAVALALNPYLGLRSQDTFTMYSNLQTEEGHWNHALLPASVRIFSAQDDLVRIVASSDPLLAHAARTSTRLVWWDFRRHASDHPDASVTYERRGERRTVARIADDPILSRGTNPLVEKVAMFRDVPPAAANDCRTRRAVYEFRNGS